MYCTDCTVHLSTLYEALQSLLLLSPAFVCVCEEYEDTYIALYETSTAYRGEYIYIYTYVCIYIYVKVN
jgi:hypothetical protein